MAESKTMELGSGETWWFTDESDPDGSGHIEVADVVGRVMVNLEDVDAFCEALKAFRDEVTKPRMTGGEKLYASCQIISGLEWAEWGRLPTSMRDRYLEQASLLGIKDDE